MHVGRTAGPATAHPWLELDGRAEGAVSEDGRVLGCYVHGLFAADAFRHAFLARIRSRPASGVRYDATVESTLDALADHLAAHLDFDRILEIARVR
jgi:adenosylcobyric acid synthase